MSTDPATPDPVAARLAEIRALIAARDDLVARLLTSAVDAREFNAAQDRLAGEMPALLGAVEAVLAAHRRAVFNVTSGEHRGKPYCLDCTTSIDHQTAYALWPCKTYRAISTALLGETGQSLGEQPHPAAHCHLGGKPHLGPCTDPEAGTDG